jgi:hypothetical protein
MRREVVVVLMQRKMEGCRPAGRRFHLVQWQWDGKTSSQFATRSPKFPVLSILPREAMNI